MLDKAPFINNETAAPADAPPVHNGGQEIATETSDQNKGIHIAPAAQHPAEEPGSHAPHTSIMDVISDVFDRDISRTDTPVFENTSVDSTSTAATDGMLPAIDEPEVVPLPTEGLVSTEENAPVSEETIAIAAWQEPVTATAEIIPDAAAAKNPEPITEPATEQYEKPVVSLEEPAAQAAVTEPMPDAVIAAEDSQASLPDQEIPVAEPNGPDNTAEIPAAAASKEDKPLFKTVIETAGAKNDFLFEPYHTVDYFASQGIKLSKMEADSKDKLGRQLKSFTEWLKSMKKLPQVSINKILSENEESKVVADAIHSIENKEVITEAMAEVFEKQGMADKAIEVYQKLSLQNPAKSAYFAAKIDALKH